MAYKIHMLKTLKNHQTFCGRRSMEVEKIAIDWDSVDCKECLSVRQKLLDAGVKTLKGGKVFERE